ncbi:MAG: hypothetical protein MHM6MM_008905, partial [Cercozoa sp. M6MM]
MLTLFELLAPRSSDLSEESPATRIGDAIRRGDLNVSPSIRADVESVLSAMDKVDMRPMRPLLRASEDAVRNLERLRAEVRDDVTLKERLREMLELAGHVPRHSTLKHQWDEQHLSSTLMRMMYESLSELEEEALRLEEAQRNLDSASQLTSVWSALEAIDVGLSDSKGGYLARRMASHDLEAMRERPTTSQELFMQVKPHELLPGVVGSKHGIPNSPHLMAKYVTFQLQRGRESSFGDTVRPSQALALHRRMLRERELRAQRARDLTGGSREPLLSLERLGDDFETLPRVEQAKLVTFLERAGEIAESDESDGVEASTTLWTQLADELGLSEPAQRMLRDKYGAARFRADKRVSLEREQALRPMLRKRQQVMDALRVFESSPAAREAFRQKLRKIIEAGDGASPLVDVHDPESLAKAIGDSADYGFGSADLARQVQQTRPLRELRARLDAAADLSTVSTSQMSSVVDEVANAMRKLETLPEGAVDAVLAEAERQTQELLQQSTQDDFQQLDLFGSEAQRERLLQVRRRRELADLLDAQLGEDSLAEFVRYVTDEDLARYGAMAPDVLIDQIAYGAQLIDYVQSEHVKRPLTNREKRTVMACAMDLDAYFTQREEIAGRPGSLGEADPKHINGDWRTLMSNPSLVKHLRAEMELADVERHLQRMPRMADLKKDMRHTVQKLAVMDLMEELDHMRVEDTAHTERGRDAPDLELRARVAPELLDSAMDGQ